MLFLKKRISILTATVIFFLIIVVVYCYLSFSGVLTPQSFSGANRNISTSNDIRVTTDKEEYKRGEEIKAKLHFDNIIYSQHGWSVEKYKNGSWRTAYPYLSFLPICEEVDFWKIEKCLGYILRERPVWTKVEKKEFTWNQLEGVTKSYLCKEMDYEWKDGERVSINRGITMEQCVSPENVSAGKYKISFQYTTNLAENKTWTTDVEEEHIYYVEKEFIIR